MANLSITTQCNRRCRYCFASNVPRHMDEATFESALDFLEASEMKQLRLLGGEPTVHPFFIDFIQKGLDRGFQLLIFSNGFMPEKVISTLEKISPAKLQVVVNTITDPEKGPDLFPKQSALFRRLGKRIVPGFTIDTPRVELDYLLSLVSEYKTAKSIRLGIAHPRLSGENRYLLPRQYTFVGKKVARFWLQAQEQGIVIDFDCGFVPCMFPEEYWSLKGHELANLGSRCNPILDILPDGQVVSCYPLEELHRFRLTDYPDAASFRNEFSERQKARRHTTLFSDCCDCAFLQADLCKGGCLAASSRRRRDHAFSFALPQRIPSDTQ